MNEVVNKRLQAICNSIVAKEWRGNKIETNQEEIHRSNACMPKLSVNCFIKSRNFCQYAFVQSKRDVVYNSRDRKTSLLLCINTYTSTYRTSYQHIVNIHTFCKRIRYQYFPWQRLWVSPLLIEYYVFFSSFIPFFSPTVSDPTIKCRLNQWVPSNGSTSFCNQQVNIMIN